MPTRPTRYRPAAIPCSIPRSLASAKDYDRRRGTSTARGYSWRWQRYAIAFKREHPFCATPGCTRPARHVDHIQPVTGPGDPLFWEPANHQPLCHSCHSRKTATVDRHAGRRRTP